MVEVKLWFLNVRFGKHVSSDIPLVASVLKIEQTPIFPKFKMP